MKNVTPRFMRTSKALPIDPNSSLAFCDYSV
jgi:hypothetical protein